MHEQLKGMLVWYDDTKYVWIVGVSPFFQIAKQVKLWWMKMYLPSCGFGAFYAWSVLKNVGMGPNFF